MRPRILPKDEIRFASRLGFLTKPIWREFFATGSINWQNKRWNYFRSSGLFRGSEDHADLLLPNAGHPLVKEVAGLVSRPPRLDQLAHDKVIARSDLQLNKAFVGCSTLVEAEAKRLEPYGGDGISSVEGGKYPDIALIVEELHVAIEVETSLKSKDRYSEIFERYMASDFDFLVYVVATREMMGAIEDVATDVGIEKSMLGFSSLKNWSENAPKADVLFGRKVMKFRNLLE